LENLAAQKCDARFCGRAVIALGVDFPTHCGIHKPGA
jgi:hypothetical protein